MLAIALYLGGVLLAVLLVALCLHRYGARPSAGHALASFAAAAALTCLLAALTTVLHWEGRPSGPTLLFWAGSWLLLCFVRPLERASLLCVPLFVLLAALSFHHIGLATSSRYTDNPAGQMRSVRRENLAQSRRLGRRLPMPKVRIRRTWHTWLTGLYEVDRPPEETPR